MRRHDSVSVVAICSTGDSEIGYGLVKLSELNAGPQPPRWCPADQCHEPRTDVGDRTLRVTVSGDAGARGGA